jgi:hypothetical protein
MYALNELKVKHHITIPQNNKHKETPMIYKNVTWDGNNLGSYTNCKHCIAVDLILRYI